MEIYVKKKVGYWHNVNKKNNNTYDLGKINLRKIFFNNLYKIGYRYFDRKKPSKYDSKIIKAFQKRFRQSKINGLIDKECLQISHYLANLLKN